MLYQSMLDNQRIVENIATGRGSGFYGVKCNLAARGFGGVVSGNLSWLLCSR
jgi:hypothetical protein